MRKEDDEGILQHTFPRILGSDNVDCVHHICGELLGEGSVDLCRKRGVCDVNQCLAIGFEGNFKRVEEL